MAADYASLTDLHAHWPKLPAEDNAEAEQKLHEASIELRGNYPNLDALIANDVMDADIPRLVACRMVKRAMSVDDDAETAGLETLQFGTGPFSFGGKVRNPDGNLYLTAADKRLLGKSRPSKKAWTIVPGG